MFSSDVHVLDAGTPSIDALVPHSPSKIKVLETPNCLLFQVPQITPQESEAIS